MENNYKKVYLCLYLPDTGEQKNFASLDPNNLASAIIREFGLNDCEGSWQDRLAYAESQLTNAIFAWKDIDLL